MKMLKDYKTEQEEQKELLADKWEGENYVFIQWNEKQMHLSTPSHFGYPAYFSKCRY